MGRGGKKVNRKGEKGKFAFMGKKEESSKNNHLIAEKGEKKEKSAVPRKGGERANFFPSRKISKKGEKRREFLL